MTPTFAPSFYFRDGQWWWLVKRSDPTSIQTEHGSFSSRESAVADADKFKNGLEI